MRRKSTEPHERHGGLSAKITKYIRYDVEYIGIMIYTLSSQEPNQFGKCHANISLVLSFTRVYNTLRFKTYGLPDETLKNNPEIDTPKKIRAPRFPWTGIKPVHPLKGKKKYF